ncbi:hypothetical protein CIRMBP1268_02415 [Enterococcus cecorum]|nr:hypothetical protein CIRMBP1268_02415 [Enterococcus cecorum]
MRYLKENSYTYKPYISIKKNELIEVLKIPKTTLDKLIKKLVSENKVFLRVKKGRNGHLIIASTRALMATIIGVKQQEREAFKRALEEAFGFGHSVIDKLIKDLNRTLNQPNQLQLFEADVG